MFYLASRGYRCVAHDRRGMSAQPALNGNGLTRAPVVEVDLGPVFGSDRIHVLLSFLVFGSYPWRRRI